MHVGLLLLAAGLVLFSLPSRAVRCYNCDDCSEVSAAESQKKGCSACYTIRIKGTRVARMCTDSKSGCNTAKETLAANANQGTVPHKWQLLKCCSDYDLCNKVSAKAVATSGHLLLLLALTVVLI